MTDRKLAKLVEKWRVRLVPGWNVILKEEAPDPDDCDLQGQAGVNTNLRTIWVWINRDIPGKSDEDLEETVVHELLHAVLQPVEDIVNDLCNAVGMETRMRVQDRTTATVEPLVERLSRAFIAMEYGGQGNSTTWEKK